MRRTRSRTALIYRLGGRWEWTPERIAELRRLWPQHGALAISRLLGCCRTTVWKQSHRLGLDRVRPGKMPWPPEKVARLKELWPSTSIPLIAADMGMTKRGVQAKARRLGLSVKGWPLHHRPNGVHTQGELWWPQEKKEQLRQLRLEGKGRKEIMAVMGITKGALSGQIHRMGLGSHKLSDQPATVERRARDKRRRERLREVQTDLRPVFTGPQTCQYVYGNPLRFCTNKRAVIGGRVSMYCREHGITINPTPRLHPYAAT
jgi:hypothetical protein